MIQKTKVALLFIVLLWTSTFITNAAKQMEKLDRGLVAVKTNDGVFLSWRMLGTDSKMVSFNIYRDGVLIKEGQSLTCLTDKEGKLSSIYKVVAIDEEETSSSKSSNVLPNPYIVLQLDRPAKGTGNCEYTPGDMSVGDVDGDGEYELFVKWDPDNAKDNSQEGTTGNVYIDCYKLSGTKLWRIDLGVNIRAGAHYTQFQVYDFDGDGKTEMACKTAPGTIDGIGNFVLMNGDNPYANYRNSAGRILDGPEYLTMFEGATGKALHTISYKPLRGNVSNKSVWEDSYGNRCDRFLACTAYLDGVHPSLVMCRGYYSQSNLWALDFRNGQFVERWFHQSLTKGKGAYGEGFHNLSVGDIDNDGFDEIVYGSATIDHDGALKYRTGLGHGDAMHISDMDPDRPGLEGWFVQEEVGSKYNGVAYSEDYRYLESGAVQFGSARDKDNGRGCAADIDARYQGFEMWSYANVYSCKGEVISTRRPSINFRIYWDGDLQDELLDGTVITKWNGNGTDEIVNFNTLNNSQSINSTKATPCLSADLFGDWREEVIFYNANNPSQIIINTTTIPSPYRLFTPMHDAMYRCAIAWQNTSYNQPPHLGFYIGDGVDHISQPDIYTIGSDPIQTINVSSTSQRVFDGYEITPIKISYGGDAEDITITTLIEGLTITKIANGAIISGTPSVSGIIKYETSGEGTPQSGEIQIDVISTNKKKVAYVTDPSASNYLNDTRILTTLKNAEELYVVEVDANDETATLAPYDLIIISEVAGSGAPLIAKLEGYEKPMLSMKVHAYKKDIWEWATTGYGDNTTATSIIVANEMKSHPIFDGVVYSNENEIAMLNSVTNKGMTYMNPASFINAQGDIQTLAWIKDAEQACIVEVGAGSTIAGQEIKQPYIQIGLNSSSYANITDNGVRIVMNACYYLLGINEGFTQNETITTENESLLIYPNPVNSKLTIHFPTEQKRSIKILLSSIDGKHILEQHATIEAGAQKIDLDLSTLPSAIYLLYITSTDGYLHYYNEVIKQ